MDTIATDDTSRRIRDRYHRRAHGPRQRLAHALTWGGVLIAVGVTWLVDGQDWFDARPHLWTLVPALLCWSGLVTMAVERTASSVVRGAVRLAIGAWLYIVFHGLWGWTLWQTWPAVLVVVGLAIVARGLVGAHVERAQ